MASTPAAASPTCDQCGETAAAKGLRKLLRCQCKEATYCGAACQKAAWKSHKRVCTARAREYTPALGHVVRIRGLERSPAYNGEQAVVRREEEGSGRWVVGLTRSPKPLALKRANMALVKTSGTHAALEVWPRPLDQIRAPADIPVSPIADWPAEWTQEKSFLCRTRRWGNPQFFGFASEEAPKPDFQLYYDCSDSDTAVNDMGNRIAQATPAYKFQGITPPVSPDGYRGNLVIVYSPTKMSGMPVAELAPHGPEGTTFSVKQMQEIMFYYTTEAAVRKAATMDNPMHRMFPQLGGGGAGGAGFGGGVGESGRMPSFFSTYTVPNH